MKGDFLLFLIEWDVTLMDDLFAIDWVDIEKIFDDLSAFDAFGHDPFDIRWFDFAVKGVFWKDFDERALGAHTKAADAGNGNLVI